MWYLQRLSILIMTVCLAGCAGMPSKPVSSEAPASAQAADHGVQLTVDSPSLRLKQWKSDGSHMTSVHGRLLLDNQPVAGATVHTSQSQIDVPTGKDGSFTLTVDQSLLAETKLSIASLKDATVSGKHLSPEMSKRLLTASAMLSVNYPIEVLKVEDDPEDASKVQVHGRVIAGSGDVVSYFQVDKYRMGGVVKDANGRPVENAVVWFDRDQGEGFGKSTPTDQDGRYSIFYWPEDEETNLSVTIGTKRYTLPEGRVFKMPENTSVEIDITLPEEGTVITDHPPYLVSRTSSGAMYTGVLVGLSLPKDVPYSVTIPNKRGEFTVTVAKKVWKQRPAFFETRMSKFVEGRLTWGDTLPAGFVQPAAEDPKHIPFKYDERPAHSTAI
ncbi:carboxypeptidase-like regulatory domain-containing protein [Paenibacillus cellulositrophicus]|uniref:carboxypeptidase-like regulatory domain-containing protein n=1 Tax=Paenibacillus cellulositrophicus TaxID=562959 RepID=UPI0020418560|nr:carboxypeptidase-like regulatory domain-containing protein [Paenibacillus cellulositrophicus]MCM3000602.1 carboxypeptidase-like regulatory domain-containing protein [Paenibacillus cellulositrophicus]